VTKPANVLILGGILLDRYFEVERFPEAGQDTLIRDSFDIIGGCSLNVAMTLKNLGALPYIVNKFGDDEVGTKIEHYIDFLTLSKSCMMKVPGGQTGYCLNILDKKGERTFLTYKGCEVEFSKELFPTILNTNPDFVYITGYYLLNHQTAVSVIELINLLRKNGSQIIFDPGPLVGDMDASSLRELLENLDWLVPNSHELTIIQKMIDISENFMEWFLQQGGKGVLVKKGIRGVDVFSPTEKIELNGVVVSAKDTTGAGDSFIGGFIVGLANGYSSRQAAALANACGAFTTTIKGPHGVFSIEDINNLLTTVKENK